MDYLKILRENPDLADEFDSLFDFFLLDELSPRDDAEGRCSFSLPGMAFARDGSGGEYHLLEDGSIGYYSSEGEAVSYTHLALKLLYAEKFDWSRLVYDITYTSIGAAVVEDFYDENVVFLRFCFEKELLKKNPLDRYDRIPVSYTHLGRAEVVAAGVRLPGSL